MGTKYKQKIPNECKTSLLSIFPVTRSSNRAPRAMTTSACCIAKFAYALPCIPIMCKLRASSGFVERSKALQSGRHRDIADLRQLSQQAGTERGGQDTVPSVDYRLLCDVDEIRGLLNECNVNGRTAWIAEDSTGDPNWSQVL